MNKRKDNTDSRFSDTEIYKKSKRGLLRIIFGRTSVVILLLVLQFALMFALFAEFEKYVSVVYGATALISAIMVIYVANTADNPAIKLSWSALIILAPVFGSLLYLFVQLEIGHRVMYRMLERVLLQTKKYSVKNEQLSDEIKNCNKQLYNISEYLFSQGSFPAYKNEVTEYYPSAEKMFERMLKELEKAERFIFLEYFIIDEGTMWGKILKILKRKVKEGVEVRVLYDGTCAVTLLPYGYPKTLSKYGIKCRMFSPLRPFVSTHYNNRDHRKFMIVDGKVAFTGGVNIADEYINVKEKFGHWKDSGIMLSGEAVNSCTLMFLQMWNIGPGKDDYEKYLISKQSTHTQTSGYIIPYADSPLDNEKVGENVYLDIINAALDYVYMMTPYLILDGEMTLALKNAAKKGVDVRIILPSVPDHKIAFAIAKSHYPELIGAGVKIYEYTPGFIHSKVFLSDDIKAVVGTINLDYRSLYLHFENAVYMHATEAVFQIKDDFNETFKECKQVRLADVKRQGVFSHLKNGFLRLLAPLM